MELNLKNPLLFTVLLALLLLSSSSSTSAQTPIVRLYGDSQENSFSKVIPNGLGYYALGSQAGVATVSYVNLAGQHQWTRLLNIPSILTDALLMTNSNNLLFVGYTLPLNSTNQSIIGTVDPSGFISSAIAYDTPGQEALTKVVANQGGTYSVLGYHSPTGQEEVVLLTLNANAVITAKDRLMGVDSRFTNDLEICGTDFVIAGSFGNTGVIYQINSAGQFVNGVMETDPYVFQEVWTGGGCSGALAVLNSSTGAPPRLVSFDANWFPLWDIQIQGVDALHQIVHTGIAGGIYVLGTATVNSIPRTVLISFSNVNPLLPPSWNWVRYIEYNETAYTQGSMAPLLLGNIAYVDGRSSNPNGLGQGDAFLAVTDPGFNTNCTDNMGINLMNHTALWNGPPGIDFTLYDIPPGLDLLDTDLPWQQSGGCSLINQIISCGGPPMEIDCPEPGVSQTFIGNFDCEEVACAAEVELTWELQDPSGIVIATGMVLSNPWFAVELASALLIQPGSYRLNLAGECSEGACQCVIEFIVPEGCSDPCPCIPDELTTAVDRGFASALIADSCRTCLIPLALNDCDVVEWFVDDPQGESAGTSVGGQAFCFELTEPGTYTLYMRVDRYTADGSLCATATYSESVTVNCDTSPTCDLSLFDNPGFNEGALAGGLNSGGSTSGWEALSGDPLILEGIPADSHDGWAVFLRSDTDSADVLVSTEDICLGKGPGSISLRLAGYCNTGGDPIPGIGCLEFPKKKRIQIHTGSDYQFGVCPDSSCIELAAIDLGFLYPTSGRWVDVRIPFDLTAAMAGATCDTWGDPHEHVNGKLVIFIDGVSGSGLEGASSQALVAVDNICIDGTLVAVQDAQQKRRVSIFPNPTSSELNLRFTGGLPKSSQFQIVDLWGRIIYSEVLLAGKTDHHLSFPMLTNGIYFVRILEDGQLFWAEKWVKQ